MDWRRRGAIYDRPAAVRNLFGCTALCAKQNGPHGAMAAIRSEEIIENNG